MNMTTNIWQKGDIFQYCMKGLMMGESSSFQPLKAKSILVEEQLNILSRRKAIEYENEIFMSTTRRSSLLFIGLGWFLYLFGGGFEIVISIECMN